MDIVWKAWYTKMSADKTCNISMVRTLNMHVPLKRHSIAHTHTHTPRTRKDCHKRLSEWKLSEVILYRVHCAPCTVHLVRAHKAAIWLYVMKLDDVLERQERQTTKKRTKIIFAIHMRNSIETDAYAQWILHTFKTGRRLTSITIDKPLHSIHLEQPKWERLYVQFWPNVTSIQKCAI